VTFRKTTKPFQIDQDDKYDTRVTVLYDIFIDVDQTIIILTISMGLIGVLTLSSA